MPNFFCALISTFLSTSWLWSCYPDTQCCSSPHTLLHQKHDQPNFVWNILTCPYKLWLCWTLNIDLLLGAISVQYAVPFRDLSSGVTTYIVMYCVGFIYLSKQFTQSSLSNGIFIINCAEYELCPSLQFLQGLISTIWYANF